MPNGILPAPQVQPEPGRARPSSPARRQRGRLDHELARGADPAASAELRFRVKRLLSREERSRLANRLITLLGDARRSNLGAFRTKTRARHDAIRHSADDLLALVLRLRDGESITARGAAMTALLVDRNASPLRRGDGQSLPYAIRAARMALDGSDRYASDLAARASVSPR